MTPRIDDETLVAYVDGELDEAAARALEAAVAGDPDLTRAVRNLREGAATLRAAFAGPALAEVPDRLIETVNAGFAEQRRRQASPRRRHWPVFAAMAASVLTVFLGLGGAYVYVDRQVEQRLASLEAARAADRNLIQNAIATALENHLSGVPATWRNAQSGSSGKVEPVRTFRNAAGQWCREYVLEAELRTGPLDREARRAVACRDAEGRWKTRLELTSES